MTTPAPKPSVRVIEELRAAYEAGTKGPWRSEGRFSVVSDPEPGWFVAECRSYDDAILRGPESRNTRDLIVAMHRYLPALIAIAEAAKLLHDALDKWSVECPDYVADAVCDNHNALAKLSALDATGGGHG